MGHKVYKGRDEGYTNAGFEGNEDEDKHEEIPVIPGHTDRAVPYWSREIRFYESDFDETTRCYQTNETLTGKPKDPAIHSLPHVQHFSQLPFPHITLKYPTKLSNIFYNIFPYFVI